MHEIALDIVSKRENFPGLFIMLEAVRGEGKLNLGDKKTFKLEISQQTEIIFKCAKAYYSI